MPQPHGDPLDLGQPDELIWAETEAICRADLVMLRANDLNMSPLGEPRTALLRSATPANVDTVIVNGRFLKRGGQLLNVDVAQVVAQANESLLAIRQRAGGAWAPRPAG